MPSLAHSPADILRWVLIDRGQGTAPSALAAWPIFASGEPASPDNCITLYDTAGMSQGRTMVDGVLYEKPGIQVRVRATTHPVGWVKLGLLRKFLAETLYDFAIHVEGQRYLIHAITNIGNIIALGKDMNNSARSLFTLNAMANIKPL